MGAALMTVNPWSMVKLLSICGECVCELQRAADESKQQPRMGDTMTDATNTATDMDEWFYTAGGQRLGPISSVAIRQLLNEQKIDAETPVWRKGQVDWKPLRDTEFGLLLSEAPPPVATAHMNNGLVWALAVAPIAYALITFVLQNAAEESSSQELANLANASFFLPIVINAALCLLDLRQLKRAGYSDGFLTFWGLVLAPVYLFMRAKRLRHKPTYAITWIVTFVISVFIA
jgi:hypothetical protein